MNFLYRTLVTIIGIPLLVYIFFGPKILFYIFCAILSLASFVEIGNIIGMKGKNTNFILYSFLLVGMYCTVYKLGFNYVFPFLIIFTYLVFFQMLYSNDKELYMNHALYMVCVTYVFLFPFFLVKIRENSMGSHLILFLFVTIWSVDIMAYLGGCSIGGPKLAPTISPKKTIAGFVSGIVGAVLVWTVYCWAPLGAKPLIKLFSNMQLFMISFAISLISQLGDLFESRFKRIFKIKDSSNIIPGHGGILDRFDSVIFTAPLYHSLIFYISGGF